MTPNITPEALAELIAPMLAGTYRCNRVWSAWQVGTMSEDDFARVDESDTPHEIAAAILAAIPELLAAQPVSSAGEQMAAQELASIYELLGVRNASDAGAEIARLHIAARRLAGEPVAEVGSNFTLCWAGSGPIAPLIERHGIKVGDKLYAAPVAGESAQAEVARLQHIIERDRTAFCNLILGLVRKVGLHHALTGEDARAASGYEWDEAGFIREFGEAYSSIMEALRSALRTFQDFSDCPRDEALVAAQAEAAQMLAAPPAPAAVPLDVVRGAAERALAAHHAFQERPGRITGKEANEADKALREAIASATQPAAPQGVDLSSRYPIPRNRAEAAALARLILAHLGVIDAHIDQAIARMETDSQHQQQESGA